MGTFTMSTDLFAPIAPHLKTSNKISLYVAKKSVKDENGNIVFKIDAKHMSLSRRQHLLDANGKTVGQVRRKRMMHTVFYIGTPNDDKHCVVKLEATCNPTYDADIYLGDKVIGEVSGNWSAKEYSIKVNDTLIANKTRGADSCCIDIEEGVDTAFVALVTLA